MKNIASKEVYKEEIKRLSKMLSDIGHFDNVCNIKSKNFDGKCYIPSNVKKANLENCYVDLINYISDKKLGL